MWICNSKRLAATSLSSHDSSFRLVFLQLGLLSYAAKSLTVSYEAFLYWPSGRSRVYITSQMKAYCSNCIRTPTENAGA